MITQTSSRRSSRPLRQPFEFSGGFSLVEVMVGMVIGMLGILVMMQVFALAEGQKRATTSGADATGNGAISMYGLQRDMQQAGYGFSDTRVLGCNVTLRGGVTLSGLGPVTINHPAIPAGDANTDTLLIVYGNSGDAVQGDFITGTSNASNSYPMQTATAFSAGDNVVAVPVAGCGAPALVMSRVAAGGVGQNVTMTSNVTSMTTAGGTLFNLGQQPKVLVYAIRNGNLTLCRYVDINPTTGVDSGNDCGNAAATGNAAVWGPIANNIVSLRAEYGRDASAVVTNATPGLNPSTLMKMPVVTTYDQTTPASSCAWSRLSAIRLTLVARNGQYDKTAVTTAAPVWAGTTSVQPVPIDLSANADWQHYRYKVFEQTVAIRNSDWLGVSIGC